MHSRAELSAASRQADADMQAALASINSLTDANTKAEISAAKQRFDRAADKAESASDKLALYDATAEARQIAVPTPAGGSATSSRGPRVENPPVRRARARAGDRRMTGSTTVGVSLTRDGRVRSRPRSTGGRRMSGCSR